MCKPGVCSIKVWLSDRTILSSEITRRSRFIVQELHMLSVADGQSYLTVVDTSSGSMVEKQLLCIQSKCS